MTIGLLQICSFFLELLRVIEYPLIAFITYFTVLHGVAKFKLIRSLLVQIRDLKVKVSELESKEFKDPDISDMKDRLARLEMRFK